MSGTGDGKLQGSELSVSAARRAAGAGGEDGAPPALPSLARRIGVVDLAPAEAAWAPVASSMSGEIIPLDDVLGRLVAGLTPS
jgi:hypothetical protein